ncbi:MAG TPA: hypothetical protein VEG39_10155 [Clostridia bacterium]|nr:hypothetical protein [Clostridia bacterium]
MLGPITRQIRDCSTERDFCFTFYCDICNSPWESVPVRGSLENGCGCGAEAKALIWRSEHDAAYERANREAVKHFNRCPICKRFVCDDCFLILPDQDLCIECAEKRKGDDSK